jgi:5-formyltetrahydrofolate cyclo-ligase
MVDVDAAKEKSRLRGEALARRKSLAGDVRAKANDAISERAFALIALHHPHCVALYWRRVCDAVACHKRGRDGR